MLLHLSFVLRVLIKVLILTGLVVLGYRLFGAPTQWLYWPYWMWLIILGIVLLEDKISIEQQHTLVFIPTKSQLSAFDWLEDEGFKLLLKKRNRRIYVIRNRPFYKRNEFVRISMDAERIRLKMENGRANAFEQAFIDVVTGDHSSSNSY